MNNNEQVWFESIGNLETDIGRLDDILDRLNQVWKGSDDSDLITATRLLGGLRARFQRKLEEAEHFLFIESQKK